MEVGSDRVQGEVDFKGKETLEYFFKDYRPIVKDREKSSEDDIHKAHALFEKTELTSYKKDLEEKSEDIVRIDIDDSEDEDDKGLISGVKTNSTEVKKIVRRYKSKKKQFINWGSKELIFFLNSIGKATEKTFSQQEVSDIVKEYVRENNLLNPHKKRRVLCDSRLHALFGRKSISRLKINDLLESHFATKEVPEDDTDFSAEDENYEEQQRLRSGLKSRKSLSREDAKEVGMSAYACITVKNIRAVYLMRSLIEEILKSPDTVDSRLAGCFVRIKSGAKTVLRNSHRLVQITGTKKVVEDYTTGNLRTNIVLLVSNQEKDVYIHMVSDDYFTEEECQELGQLVKEGHLKRPTVEELEKKALDLHEDITNHRIKKDIALLQNLIKRVNEKGWRRELLEYADKLEMLQKRDVQDRLLQDLPTIVADAEMEISDAAVVCATSVNKCEGAENARTAVQRQESDCNGKAINIHNTFPDGINKEAGTANVIIIIDSPERENREMEVSCVATENEAPIDKFRSENSVRTQVSDCKGTDISSTSTYGATDAVISIESPETESRGEDHKAKENMNSEHENPSSEEYYIEGALWWMYVDPSGVIQGPFLLEELREWYEDGYFPDGFKIWKSNQSQENAILLVDALHQISET